jgi:hypothetical protein
MRQNIFQRRELLGKRCAELAGGGRRRDFDFDGANARSLPGDRK